MKKTLFGLFLAMAAAMLLSACGTYYNPQSVRMPLVSQKGELVVDANVPLSAWSAVISSEAIHKHDFSIRSCFYNASATYAFADHWAAQLSSRYFFDFRHEAMVGWYAPLGEQATVEVYGGYGYAKCKDDSGHNGGDPTIWSQEGAAHTFFAQGDIGFPSYKPKWCKRCAFTAGVGLRIGGVYCDWVTRNFDHVYDSEAGVYVWSQAGSSDGWSLRYEIQPMLKLGFGGERLKLEAAAGLSDLGGWEGPRYEPWTASLTLSYRVPLLRKKD